MNPNKLNTRYIIAKNRTRKDGLSPLFCRLAYEEKRKQFATGLFINPDNWHAAKQKAFPPNTDNTQINAQLSLIKQEINQAFFPKSSGKNF